MKLRVLKDSTVFEIGTKINVPRFSTSCPLIQLMIQAPARPLIQLMIQAPARPLIQLMTQPHHRNSPPKTPLMAIRFQV